MKSGETMPLRLQSYLKKSNPNISPCNQTGFIIVRCIQDELTSKYWYKSYQSIREFYPTIPIVIIDDHSNPQYIKPQLESTLVHCRIISSTKQPGCGELLGYYYFFHYHWFKKAVIIHDSVFLKRPIRWDTYNPVRFLWHIETKEFDNVEWETNLLKKCGSPYLNLYQQKQLWKGCFGVMSVIDYDFLKKISTPLFSIIDQITTRNHRCCIERIFAVLCCYYYPELVRRPSIMGSIHQYSLGWGYHYTTFEQDLQKRKIKFPALVKVWTGR